MPSIRFRALALAFVSFLVAGCGGDFETGDIGTAAQNLLAPGTYLYLNCNATGWGLDATTRVQPTTDPNVYQVTYNVTQP